MKPAISSVLFALPLALLACGGDDGGGVVVIDAGDDGVDACVAKASAPGTITMRGSHKFQLGGGHLAHGGCQATASYGAATPGNAFAVGGDVCTQVNPENLEFGGLLNTDATPDLFSLQLYKGFSVFASGEIRTGTYPLTGDETQYADCGVCALIYADIDTTTAVPGSTYMATGGSVTITSVYPNLTGTVSNLTFVHVDINETTFVSTPNADNCPSAITSMSFDAPVEAPE